MVLPVMWLHHLNTRCPLCPVFGRPVLRWLLYLLCLVKTNVPVSFSGFEIRWFSRWAWSGSGHSDELETRSILSLSLVDVNLRQSFLRCKLETIMNWVDGTNLEPILFGSEIRDVSSPGLGMMTSSMESVSSFQPPKHVYAEMKNGENITKIWIFMHM